MNRFDLAGKKALVVGVGGLGTAIASGLAEHGAWVAVADLDLNRAQSAADLLAVWGRKALTIKIDVTDEGSVCKAADRLAASWGGVDLLVNAVGVAARMSSISIPVGRLRETLEVNAVGTFLCCQAFGRQMIGRGGGKIVNLSSVRGRFGTPTGMADYCASKGAVDSLTRQLAVEWAPYGVYVNAVAPTVVETELTVPILANPDAAADLVKRIPLGRWAQPEDIVGPVLFLTSPASDYVTGQILFVDGGLTAVV